MLAADLEQYELQRYRSSIEAVAQSCLIGVTVDHNSASYIGGLPAVDDTFTWPTKMGYPLNFIAQFKCEDLSFLPFGTGYLQFFYDNRHWGYSRRDAGHAVVLHQQGERQLQAADLPTCEIHSLFGLVKRNVQPKVYQRINIAIETGQSYPSLERKQVHFADDVAEECYIEYCTDNGRDIQLGGYPNPIQADEMERDCAKVCGFGQPTQWSLLLQLAEIGNMTWGDGGALYWFIHEDDLRKGRLDRTWVISQCH